MKRIMIFNLNNILIKNPTKVNQNYSKTMLPTNHSTLILVDTCGKLISMMIKSLTRHFQDPRFKVIDFLQNDKIESVTM